MVSFVRLASLVMFPRSTGAWSTSDGANERASAPRVRRPGPRSRRHKRPRTSRRLRGNPPRINLRSFPPRQRCEYVDGSTSKSEETRRQRLGRRSTGWRKSAAPLEVPRADAPPAPGLFFIRPCIAAIPDMVVRSGPTHLAGDSLLLSRLALSDGRDDPIGCAGCRSCAGTRFSGSDGSPPRGMRSASTWSKINSSFYPPASAARPALGGTGAISFRFS